MKKSAIFFTITALLILFSACSTGEQYKETDSQMNMDDMAVVSVDGEFDKIIADNPIDKEFIWGSEGCESEARIMMAADYIRQWETETEHALDILEGYLSREDYQSLSLAYEGWKQYRENTILVEQKIFYVGGDYLDNEGTIIGCNDTYPQVIEAEAVKTKDYAVELLSIEYAFTGNVEWAKIQQ